MKTHKEKIICPNCKTKQLAIVEHTLPWYWNYTHKCIKCGYWITESEWEVSDAKKEAGCLALLILVVIMFAIFIIIL